MRAFIWLIVEATMPFSLGSYLLGVITVVGALAFGVGGGVFLTHTAMKESPAGQTRVERLARAEPETPPAPQAPVTQVIAPAPGQAAVAPNPAGTPDQERPAAVAAMRQDAAPTEQPAIVPSNPLPAVQAGAPKPDAARKPEEAPRQVQAARAPQPPKQVEPTERTEAKPVESRETDRRAERARRYADRRLPDTDAPRMRQRREEPVQEVVVSRPPEPPHFDLFGGLFGRPMDVNN